MESDRIMFEIYRAAEYDRGFQVVYFTELDEHNKETEINRAMAGEHFYDGFLKSNGSTEAKQIVDAFVDRLNRGESVSASELEAALGDHSAA